MGAALGVVVSSWLVWRYRKRSVLELMAVTAVIGQMWTYHRRYDEVAVVLLLVALGRLAITQRTRWAVAGAIAVGLSLWLPHRDIDWQWVGPVQYLVWIAGLVVLLRHSTDVSDPTAAAVPVQGDAQ